VQKQPASLKKITETGKRVVMMFVPVVSASYRATSVRWTHVFTPLKSRFSPIEDNNTLELSARDQTTLAETILNPPEPNAKLKAAVASTNYYRTDCGNLVKLGDEPACHCGYLSCTTDCQGHSKRLPCGCCEDVYINANGGEGADGCSECS